MPKEQPKTQGNPCLNHPQVNISVSLVQDAEMKKLNLAYKNRDYTTDVLSFEIAEEVTNGVYQLGEVAVNVEQAKRQAKDYGNDLEHEIAELVAHGVLHLLGVHHDGDD